MAKKRGCSFGRRKNGRCPSRAEARGRRRSDGLGGVARTCARYKKGAGGVMRCAAFTPEHGVPPYRGQRKG